MTPPAKTPPAAREVKADDGKVVKITPSGRGAKATIAVAWLCGSRRVFTIDELRRNIELLDGPASKYPMWLNPTDRDKQKFFARLKDGKLTANEGMRDNGYVAWADLKRELQATIAEVLS